MQPLKSVEIEPWCVAGQPWLFTHDSAFKVTLGLSPICITSQINSFNINIGPASVRFLAATQTYLRVAIALCCCKWSVFHHADHNFTPTAASIGPARSSPIYFSTTSLLQPTRHEPIHMPASVSNIRPIPSHVFHISLVGSMPLGFWTVAHLHISSSCITRATYLSRVFSW